MKEIDPFERMFKTISNKSKIFLILKFAEFSDVKLGEPPCTEDPKGYMFFWGKIHRRIKAWKEAAEKYDTMMRFFEDYNMVFMTNKELKDFKKFLKEIK